MLLKQKPSKHLDCSVFITLRHLYSAGSACVLLTIFIIHRYGQLYLHCSLIYLGSFQLFLHSDQPLSEGEIILVQRLPVGEAALSTPEAVVFNAPDRQTALMCN